MTEYVSATEAAQLLGRSESYIRKQIGRGNLDATKVDGSWRIALSDLDIPPGTHRVSPIPLGGTHGTSGGTHVPPGAPDGTPIPSGTSEWRDDLLAQVARLEADKAAADERASELREDMGLQIEASKARVIDLERELTMRDTRIADMEAMHAGEVSDLRGQVAILEAKVRETLEERAEENGQLANRIADLVTAQQEMQTRVYELEPVANQVPMLQAAVEEKDATLSERERELELREHELNNVRDDIEAIANRPVTGGVFRLLTKGKLRV